MSERVTLLGLDFGSTTSCAIAASASISSGATPFKTLTNIKIEHLCDPVLTPFTGQSINTSKISALIEHWLKQSDIKLDNIFSGGSMITGLAAQADNAQALTRIITNIVGESVIATADDPCLESWLAFKGSCAALSRYHTDAPIINLDIGGGTTNIALGVNGDVLQTGCYFIGARHFQFVVGSYKITAMSRYGEALLEALTIKKIVGETFNADEVAKIMAFYVRTLEAIVQADTDYLSKKIAKKHTQISINLDSNTRPKLTFSGGVGELIYKISANELLPTTTIYGDFGIDLAQVISRSSVLSANLKTHIPEHKGRATVVGLTLHSTEISGNSIYLPNPNCLPLRNVPIVAKLVCDLSTAQWQSAFALAANCPQGACIQISASNQLEQIRSLAMQIRHTLQANIHGALRPLILLIDSNIGKALGNYICDWGQLDYNLMVIDEVALRDAQFVNIGRLHQQMIPVSFYGLN